MLVAHTVFFLMAFYPDINYHGFRSEYIETYGNYDRCNQALKWNEKRDDRFIYKCIPQTRWDRSY